MDIHNAPLSEYEAWERYPKFNWIYDTAKVLTAQHIPYSIYKGDFTTMLNAVSYGHELTISDVSSISSPTYFMEGYIFTRKISGKHTSIHVAVSKGEIKWEEHMDNEDNIIQDPCGDLKLKVSAMVSMHFSKYNGLIRFDAVGKDIVSGSLALDISLIEYFPEDWAKKVNRLYNNRPWGK